MRKGFTLLELIVVVIIIGILATLGFTQYGRMIEKSRGSESRAILGSIRTFAAAYRLEHGNLDGFTAVHANIGAGADQIPSACATTHYFFYAVTAAAGQNLVLTATRCTGANGKQPGALTAGTLTLTCDFSTGTDTWGGTGGY
jgi:prepilin-type N-terminal cleavage/methylation domain-containing protein